MLTTSKPVIRLFTLMLIGVMFLSACGGKSYNAPEPSNPLVLAAQQEGSLTTIALPHDWCNYGEAIERFKAKYHIKVNELNPDGSSGDELDAIQANKGSKGPEAPDVVDVGFSFGEPNKTLFMPYKVSAWNTIPPAAKSTDGYWHGDYYGVLSFLVNTDVQPDAPKDWADLLDPKYKGQVALSGDPRSSNQAIQSVFAASLANGGSPDDARPGLDYFARLNRAGNLIPLIANNDLVASGKIPVRITWDYLALDAIETYAGKPATRLVIPATGRFAGMYVQAISAYAPHPNAAKLWMEFLYSDEGQIIWMKGYCHPVREADMRVRGVVPADLAARLPDVSGAVFPTAEQLLAAKTLITENWDSVVGADIQKAP